MCTKDSYCSSYRCSGWRAMKQDLVDLYYALGEASLGAGGLPRLEELIGDLLNLLDQGTISAVDLVKLWGLENVTLADVLRKAAKTYELTGFGPYDWVPTNMETAGQALDKILITGKPSLGLSLHPELRSQDKRTLERRLLVKFVDEFVWWHQISPYPGFPAHHVALFPGAVAGILTQ